MSTPTVAATPGATGTGSATPTASVDLSTLDVCSLLDLETVRELTGTSIDFVDQASPGFASGASCFWGAPSPVPPYVELKIDRRAGLAGFNYEPGQGCTSAPISVDASIEAVGGTCSDPQPKVFLLLADNGLALTLLVNAPERPLQPADLVATGKSRLDDLLGR